MKLRQLQFFIAVAEELSFSRAAIKLHVAQPSLSTQIKVLEEEVGARLFERDKRHVSLTPAGRRFQQRAISVLSMAESAKSEARSTARGQLGTIALGYTALSMFSTALPHAIRQFRRREPNVVMTLRELTSLEQLHELGERTLDVGVLRKVDVAAPKGDAAPVATGCPRRLSATCSGISPPWPPRSDSIWGTWPRAIWIRSSSGGDRYRGAHRSMPVTRERAVPSTIPDRLRDHARQGREAGRPGCSTRTNHSAIP